MSKIHRMVCIVVLLISSCSAQAAWQQTLFRPLNRLWSSLTYSYRQAFSSSQHSEGPLNRHVDQERRLTWWQRIHYCTRLFQRCSAMLWNRMCVYFGYRSAPVRPARSPINELALQVSRNDRSEVLSSVRPRRQSAYQAGDEESGTELVVPQRPSGATISRVDVQRKHQGDASDQRENDIALPITLYRSAGCEAVPAQGQVSQASSHLLVSSSRSGAVLRRILPKEGMRGANIFMRPIDGSIVLLYTLLRAAAASGVSPAHLQNHNAVFVLPNSSLHLLMPEQRCAPSVHIEVLPDDPGRDFVASNSPATSSQSMRTLQRVYYERPRCMPAPNTENSTQYLGIDAEYAHAIIMKQVRDYFDDIEQLIKRIKEPHCMTEQENIQLINDCKYYRERIIALSQYWTDFDSFAATIAANTEKANRDSAGERLLSRGYYDHAIFDGMVDFQSHEAVAQCVKSALEPAKAGNRRDRNVIRQIGHTLRDRVGKICYDRFIRGKSVWQDSLGNSSEHEALIQEAQTLTGRVLDCLIECSIMKTSDRNALVSVPLKIKNDTVQVQRMLHTLGSVLGLASAEFDQQKKHAFVDVCLDDTQKLLEGEHHPFFNELFVEYVHTLVYDPEQIADWIRKNGLSRSFEQGAWGKRAQSPVCHVDKQVYEFVQWAIAGESLVKELCESESVNQYIDRNVLSLHDHLQALVNITWYFHARGLLEGYTFTHSGSYMVHDLQPVATFIEAYIKRARIEQPIGAGDSRQLVASCLGLGDHPLAYSRMSSHLKHSRRAGINGVPGTDFGIDIRFDPKDSSCPLLPDGKQHLLYVPLADGRFLLKPEGAGTSIFDLPELVQHSTELLGTLQRQMGQHEANDDVCRRERVPKSFVTHMMTILAYAGLDDTQVELIGECIRKDGGYAAAQVHLADALEKCGCAMSEQQRMALVHELKGMSMHRAAPKRIGNEVVIWGPLLRAYDAVPSFDGNIGSCRRDIQMEQLPMQSRLLVTH